MKSLKNSSPDETLKSFLSNRDQKYERYEAYINLTTNSSFDYISEKMGKIMGLNFKKSIYFDECDAYIASVNLHDVTLLCLHDRENDYTIDIMIEPGERCDTDGECVNLTDDLCYWLNAKKSDLGEFFPIPESD